MKEISFLQRFAGRLRPTSKPLQREMQPRTFIPEVVIGDNPPQLLNIKFDIFFLRKICKRLDVKSESLSGIILKGGLVDDGEKNTLPIPENAQQIKSLFQLVHNLPGGSYNPKSKIISIYPDNIVLTTMHAGIQVVEESKAPKDIVLQNAANMIKKDIGVTVVEELVHSTQDFHPNKFSERLNPRTKTLRLEYEATKISLDSMDLIKEAIQSTRTEYLVSLESLLELAMPAVRPNTHNTNTKY